MIGRITGRVVWEFGCRLDRLPVLMDTQDGSRDGQAGEQDEQILPVEQANEGLLDFHGR